MHDHESQTGRQGRVEIGIIVAGPLDPIDRRAVELAAEQVRGFLNEHFPEFEFDLFHLRQPELDGGPRIDPSVLLQQAVRERDAHHWDFAFVLTSAELRSNYSPFCFAALSRPLDAAVFSLSLIDPLAAGQESAEIDRINTIAHRLSRLMLHALGHLTGLAESGEPAHLMFHPAEAEELDAMHVLEPDQLAKQRQAFYEVADQRLEEGTGARLSRLGFFLRAAWINHREIAEAIVAARPWQFPQRLSRLTIASVSTVMILYMTAEAWDLALSQSWPQIVVLILCALSFTTGYVVLRQQLLIRRGQRRSEQTVVTSISAVGIVLVGMMVTWVGLFLIGFTVAWLLFHPHLIANWAASSSLEPQSLGIVERSKMSLFSASLGLLIGALGASFEAQHYFRHVIFVDEEI